MLALEVRAFTAFFLLSSFGCIQERKPADDGVGDELEGEPVLPADDLDSDGYTGDVDCDDGDARVNPGADELCDGIDDDCDGVVDEPDAADAATWYADADGDGYGDPDGIVAYGCSAPTGFTASSDDCNDGDPHVHPGADEPGCTDPTDYNCDGSVGYADADGDGWVACQDCDDATGAVNPSMTEVCDGLDDDCDGTIDGPDAADAVTWYTDGDGDGHGDPGTAQTGCEPAGSYVAFGDDCDDTDAAVYPEAPETCTDTIDRNCDGSVGYADADGDGWAACEDCDDGDATVNPDAAEVCDGHDDDCDGIVDDTGLSMFYADTDGDGFGDGSAAIAACTAPAGYVADATDCDDAAAGINPAAPEICDGLDDDCDGAVDDDAVDGTPWYADADGDGYGDAAIATAGCSAPSGFVADATDCDDTSPTVHPSAAEADDLVDEDCDGFIDEDFVSAGDIVISEVHRRLGRGSSPRLTDGEWFEILNTGSREVALDNWYFYRYNASDGADSFSVDPAEGLVIDPGGYMVFCRSSAYDAATNPGASTLVCDYVWGDDDESASYSGTYRSNTFLFARNNDRFAAYIEGTETTGRVVDDVEWFYDHTDGYWPRDAAQSMSLDPGLLDATANDSLSSWCSTPATSAYVWYSVGSTTEYGTPGAANYDCP